MFEQGYLADARIEPLFVAEQIGEHEPPVVVVADAHDVLHDLVLTGCGQHVGMGLTHVTRLPRRVLIRWTAALWEGRRSAS